MQSSHEEKQGSEEDGEKTPDKLLFLLFLSQRGSYSTLWPRMGFNSFKKGSLSLYSVQYTCMHAHTFLSPVKWELSQRESRCCFPPFYEKKSSRPDIQTYNAPNTVHTLKEGLYCGWNILSRRDALCCTQFFFCFLFCIQIVEGRKIHSASFFDLIISF